MERLKDIRVTKIIKSQPHPDGPHLTSWQVEGIDFDGNSILLTGCEIAEVIQSQVPYDMDS